MGNLPRPVLDRIGGAPYFTVHNRSADGGVAREKLSSLVEHLDELKTALHCGSCGKPVWHLAMRNGPTHQCASSGRALSA
jgi:hypothetical protein